MALVTLLLVLLLLSAYGSFAVAMIATHEGPHHHHARGFLSEVATTVQDTVRHPVVLAPQSEVKPLLTLRDYLAHPDGFHMAFAPAFFGYFAYYGALTAMEEETDGRIVPALPRDGDSKKDCGLKSVSGASAGAMAAVMIAAGIQPRKAAEFASTITWNMVSDPPGIGGFVKGRKFEEVMKNFLIDNAQIQRNSPNPTYNASTRVTPFQLEEALVPVAVSGFDLLKMKGKLMSRGCMAKAARSSATFPGLLQPVAWRESYGNNEDGDSTGDQNWLPDSLLIDGGVTDGLGLLGLSAFTASTQKKRVINVVVGDFGFRGPRGISEMPEGINAESLVSIAIVNTPTCGPWAMENGPKIVESARLAMIAAIDMPMERGACDNHFVLRVDASKWLDGL